ncbi:MAG: hypothetical protein J6X92_07300, partial [Bacteroidales bacterium]|nr:hypothetical protein [Bacteroidales bacterium]
VQMGFVPGVGLNVSGDYVLENGWWKGHFTVGGYAGFKVRDCTDIIKQGEYIESFDYINTNFAFMPRATYGLNITDDFEVHAGVMTGFAVKSYNTNLKNTEVVFCGGPFVGCKFFFTEGVGLTAEMAYCNDLAPLLNAGLTFKF